MFHATLPLYHISSKKARVILKMCKKILKMPPNSPISAPTQLFLQEKTPKLAPLF
jgi:hypothetical protein